MKKIIIKLTVLSFAILFLSCNNLLDEKSYDFVSPNDLGDSPAAADQFVIGAYNTLSEGSFFLYGAYLYLTNMDCDYATGADWAFGTVGAGNPQGFWGINTMWSGCYMLIYRANLGISYISAMKSVPDDYKNNALGQLKFLKAWAYFNLVRNYGEIPVYKTSISEGADPDQPRQSIPDVYAYIIELLQDASNEMYTTKDAKFVPGHTSQGAANTLLAKVYLTIASASLPTGATVYVTGGEARVQNGSNWTPVAAQVYPVAKQQVAGYESFNSADYFKKAQDEALKVMNSGEYDLLPYDQLWTVANRNKTEQIWSLQAISGDALFGNSICQDYVGIYLSSGMLQGSWYGLSAHWYSLFEPQDKRILDGVVHRWSVGFDGSGNLQYNYFPASDSVKVRTHAAYDSKGDCYDGTEIYQAAAGWSVAKLLKFATVTDRKTTKSDFYFPFLRYADVLLIYAEAANEVNAGPTAEAYAALNRVRTRSNASTINNMDQAHFRSEVLNERARELALEADRRYDQFRWGIYEQSMNAIDIDGQGILKRRSQRNLLYPIPTAEITANKNINTNNFGW